jgi:hypothetical protein
VELTPEERLAMEAFRGEVPPALWPFDAELPPEPESSLGLRHGQEIAGWMVTHRVVPNLIRYTMLFVREQWRTPASSFALLAESLRRKHAAYGTEMNASLAVQADNQPMLRLLDGKFRPWVTSRSELRASAKTLR